MVRRYALNAKMIHTWLKDERFARLGEDDSYAFAQANLGGAILTPGGGLCRFAMVDTIGPVSVRRPMTFENASPPASQRTEA